MDLIYMNDHKEDIGAMKDYKLDLAYGIDENDFELAVDINNHVCAAGYFIYAEGTEYGGIIDKIRVDTDNETIKYLGRTWHGILNSKIIEPDADADYLVVSGEANAVISTLIARMGLEALFCASQTDSGIEISDYQMNRYIAGYDGIRKMLRAVGAKLKLNYEDGYVMLSVEPAVDYSENDEFDSTQIAFNIEKNYKPVNHVICLGRGELAERIVIHLYADENGEISTTQSITGLDEITAIYENTNAESDEELQQGGMELLQSYWNTDTMQINIDATQNYDIGDIVGARENITNMVAVQAIVKKIVTIQNDEVSINYKVGE